MSVVAILSSSRIPPRNTETTTYVNRIVAAGGTITLAARNAVDAFISEGKVDGWWSKILDCSMCVGSNLDAARCKLVAATGTPTSYSNNNFVDADYTQAGGLGDLSNTNKYLGTGVTPSALTMSIDNMAIAVETIEDGYTGTVDAGINPVDPYISDNPAAGTPNFEIGSANLGSNVNQTNAQYGINGSTVKVVSVSGNRITARMDGLGVIDGGLAPGLLTTPTTEMTICRSKRTGSFSYGRVKVGATFIFGSGLTSAEQKAFCLSIIRFNRSLRTQAYSTRMLFLGDSITMGTKCALTESWAYIVSTALGVQRINTGVSAVPLNVLPGYFAPQLVALYTKYEDGLELGISKVIIMIGSNDAPFTGAVPGSNYSTSLQTICQFFRNEGKQVILCSLPWMSTDILADSAVQWRDAAQTVASNVSGVIFADVWQALADALPHSTYFAETPPTAFHPNPAGHAVMAQTILDAIP